MKRTTTEIFIEVEETIEMRLSDTKKVEPPKPPIIIGQIVCPHCGQTIQ